MRTGDERVATSVPAAEPATCDPDEPFERYVTPEGVPARLRHFGARRALGDHDDDDGVLDDDRPD